MPALIVLDPGHGRYDKAGAIPGFYEGTNNYNACLLLRDELKKYDGVTVMLTRIVLDENPDLPERGAMGQQADLFYSWHSNGFSKEGAYGITTYYSLLIPESRELCRKLTAALLPVFGAPTYDRGQYTKPYSEAYPSRDYYGVIRHSVLTNGNALSETPKRSACRHSIIVEHGFHSNNRECAVLADPRKLAQMAAAEAAAIAEYFGLHKKTKEPEPAQEENDMYKVTVSGEYNTLEQAQAMVALLEKFGVLAKAEEVAAPSAAQVPDVQPVVTPVPETEPEPVAEPAPAAPAEIVEGNKVKLNPGAAWSNGKTPSGWVYNVTLTVLSVDGYEGTAAVSTNGTGYTGTAYVRDLTKA